MNKKRINLTIRKGLVDNAKKIGLNISEIVEFALEEELAGYKNSKIDTITLKQKMPRGMNLFIQTPKKVKVIKKLELYSLCYPEFGVDQFDPCKDLEEEVGIWAKINFKMKKKDFFKFIQVVASDFEISGKDSLPCKITLETEFNKIRNEEKRCMKKLRFAKGEKKDG